MIVNIQRSWIEYTGWFEVYISNINDNDIGDEKNRKVNTCLVACKLLLVKIAAGYY